MLLKNILLTLLMTFSLLLDTQKIIFMILCPPININSFFLNLTGEIEAKHIILFLNASKAINPNSIPNKSLKLLIKLFNLPPPPPPSLFSH